MTTLAILARYVGLLAVVIGCAPVVFKYLTGGQDDPATEDLRLVHASGTSRDRARQAVREVQQVLARKQRRSDRVEAINMWLMDGDHGDERDSAPFTVRGDPGDRIQPRHQLADASSQARGQR